jgi:hypothetical protein
LATLKNIGRVFAMKNGRRLRELRKGNRATPKRQENVIGAFGEVLGGGLRRDRQPEIDLSY